MAKKIRKRGELQAAIGSLLAKEPRITAALIADKLAITKSNAYIALRRFRGNAAGPPPKKRSAAKGGPKPPKAAPVPVARVRTKAQTLTERERYFVALMSFIGVERSEALVAAEKAKIMATVAVFTKGD